MKLVIINVNVITIVWFFPVVRSGTNDFCPCLTQACPTFADIPYYPLSPSWSFLFEEYPNIYNSGIEGSLVLAYNGKIMLMPERRGSVLFCNGVSNCLLTTVYGLPDATCASDLTKCTKGGFTFSFWVKIGVNEKARLATPSPYYTTNFIGYSSQGMSILYDHMLEKWQVVVRQGTFSGDVKFSGNNAERWHHIVGIAYSSLYVSAFLDGEMMGNKSVSSVTSTPYTVQDPKFFYGGANPALGRFWIDDFKMWSVPLTADQIQQNYIDESTDGTIMD